jgi:integrase
MARPIKHPSSGVYLFKQRIPSDLAAKARGRVALPLDDQDVSVAISAGYVQMSLRTKDAALAAARHVEADAALRRYWQALRAGPRPLSHRQAVAVSADAYHHRIAEVDDPIAVADRQKSRANLEGFFRELDAMPQQDRVPAMAKWVDNLIAEQGQDFIAVIAASVPGIVDAEQEALALEMRYGGSLDAALAKRGVVSDSASRPALLREFRRAELAGSAALRRMLDGDFSDEEKPKFFPAFEPVGQQPAALAVGPNQKVLSARRVYDLWVKKRLGKLSDDTLRRYKPTLYSLSAFTNDRDVRQMRDVDIHAWAMHRTSEGISARTVNRNDLVAVNSVFNYMMSLNGGRLLQQNPAEKVKLDEDVRHGTRENHFRSSEIRAILTASSQVKIEGKFPRAAASRRWAPWIAAYSGARIQEIVGLRRDEVRLEGKVWVFDFKRTKTYVPRRVPVHEHLIELGLIDYVEGVSCGPLFFDGPDPENQPKTGTRDYSKKTPEEKRASEVATWVRKVANLDKDVDPNHFWRHTFKTIAQSHRVRMDDRWRDALTGHAIRSVGRSYEHPDIEDLVAAMTMFPRYDL